jgi:hypothetical protein
MPINSRLRAPRVWHKPTSIRTCDARPGRWPHPVLLYEQGKDYDVIACIAGRCFKVRREDMRRLLQATNGKVFTLATMHLLIDHSRIREYRVR